jgi:hypothetical protein
MIPLLPAHRVAALFMVSLAFKAAAVNKRKEAGIAPYMRRAFSYVRVTILNIG